MARATFGQVTGDPGLELLNTVSWRLRGPGREELLGDSARVLDWALQTGFLDETEHARLAATLAGDAAAAEALVADARGLREDAYAMLVEGDAAAAERVASRYRVALGRARLEEGGPEQGGRWRWVDSAVAATTPVDRAVRAVLDLAGSDRLRLLHQCEDDECGWVYLDTSPRHNRRWCSASDCGDRNRARAYYRRHRVAE
ncbi:CGNR zinc finger domain-containing protein [Phycicoccus endophyticus]|uniref:CGNR zinc finger domain-containing protein n=1 Tax=Phycicoccus endophyticus TaxID=1690220 RepID=A0A7G9R077_9MICO|nr:CGNR zinc finger domain-containing protein [Phycicoccus endophyticus]NHI20201.1 CGNR zinc finger domain-containing protein [Phycicoccus endophyticus]QNN49002.1 CGNR zinc finger domain-containing protein [Phycicoccus endophyticus]GGL44483.1 hypothetical protein GCM10012283_28830 [Phycicoccus endophyticus]